MSPSQFRSIEAHDFQGTLTSDDLQLQRVVAAADVPNKNAWGLSCDGNCSWHWHERATFIVFAMVGAASAQI